MRRTAQSAGGSFRIRRLRVRRRRRNPTDETMQSTPRRDPEWEHWPGRPTGEEGVRSRLCSRFMPSDAEDAITELITEHSRELETRAAELLLHDQMADGGWNCEQENGSTRGSFHNTIT